MEEDGTIELLPKNKIDYMEINIFRKVSQSDNHFDIIDYQD